MQTYKNSIVTHLISSFVRTQSSPFTMSLKFSKSAGRPAEYFDIYNGNEYVWRTPPGIRDAVDYLDSVIVYSTTAADLYSVKLHWHQTERLRTRLFERLPQQRSSETTEWLSGLLHEQFGRVRHIFAGRRNKVAQGMPYYQPVGSLATRRRHARKAIHALAIFACLSVMAPFTSQAGAFEPDGDRVATPSRRISVCKFQINFAESKADLTDSAKQTLRTAVAVAQTNGTQIIHINTISIPDGRDTSRSEDSERARAITKQMKALGWPMVAAQNIRIADMPFAPPYAIVDVCDAPIRKVRHAKGPTDGEKNIRQIIGEVQFDVPIKYFPFFWGDEPLEPISGNLEFQTTWPEFLDQTTAKGALCLGTTPPCVDCLNIVVSKLYSLKPARLAYLLGSTNMIDTGIALYGGEILVSGRWGSGAIVLIKNNAPNEKEAILYCHIGIEEPVANIGETPDRSSISRALSSRTTWCEIYTVLPSSPLRLTLQIYGPNVPEWQEITKSTAEYIESMKHK